MTANFTKHAKKVTFSDAKVGDKVWSITEGWGIIKNRSSPHTTYPLNVAFDSGVYRTYTLWGLSSFTDHNPTLFWDEVQIGTPDKPLPQLEVDAKVFVWGQDGRKRNRHFSHFDEEGRLFAFSNGQTSFSNECSLENGVTSWSKWELAE